MEFTRWALDSGADVNAYMISGWTATHAAAYKGNPDVLSLLLERKANKEKRATKRDVKVKDGKNLKPIDVASSPHIRKMLED